MSCHEKANDVIYVVQKLGWAVTILQGTNTTHSLPILTAVARISILAYWLAHMDSLLLRQLQISSCVIIIQSGVHFGEVNGAGCGGLILLRGGGGGRGRLNCTV